MLLYFSLFPKKLYGKQLAKIVSILTQSFSLHVKETS